MANYILATDSRGYKVETNDIKFDYILSKHEESADEITENLVKEAIENPDNGEIRKSMRHDDCHIYYKKVKGKKAELKVVVRYDGDFGELQTFHFQSNRPSNEVLIWPTTNH